MKSITPKELEILKKHLLKKPFVYEQVFLEFLDHYATAYEQSDLAMEELFLEQDREFTNRKISIINERYKEELDKQILRAHFQVVTDLFKFPQLVLTALVLLLGFYFSDALFAYTNLKLTLFFTMAFIPFVFFGYVAFKRLMNEQEIHWKLKNAHLHLLFLGCLIPVNLVHINSLYSAFASGKHSILDVHPILTVSILFLQLATCISVFRVGMTKLKPVIAG